MSTRDDLIAGLAGHACCFSEEDAQRLVDAHRDEVALEIGRDALRDGVVPTLTRLVGEVNAQKLMADYRDGVAHEMAEQQRDERPQHNPDWQCWGDAADLIDPVKDSSR